MKKTLKILLILFIIAALAVCAIVGSYFLVGISGGKSIIKDEISLEKADAIVILGAKVYSSGNPSPMLRDRLLKGYELYKKGVSGKILVSGDHGTRGYNEVSAMRQYLVELGVPEGDIFMDHAGFNTYDSIYRARDVFLCKKIVVVTQEFHLVRALYIANAIGGISAQGVASDLSDYGSIRYNIIREFGSRPKAVFYTLFKMKPKYLGKEIPISGSGYQTEDGLS